MISRKKLIFGQITSFDLLNNSFKDIKPIPHIWKYVQLVPKCDA